MLLDYPHRRAGHCGSGALRDLVEWAGLGWNGPPHEGLVFALGGGLGFSYLRVPGIVPPIYLVGRGGDLELDLLRRLGAAVEFKQSDDPILGWQWVVDELDDGRPVMVWADIAKLPYLRVRLQMSRHDIVVIGYDDDTGTAFVADNDRENIQEVPYEALADARSSTAFPVPTRHATFAVRWPDSLPDLTGIAAEAFAASTTSMITGGDDLVDLSILPPGACAGSGLSGVQAFAEDVAAWPDELDPVDLEAALRVLPVFIDKAGTGGGLFRLLQSQGCAQVAELLGSTEAAEAAAVAADCAAAWQALARAAVADESLNARAARVARAAATLPDHERNLVAALQHASESLNAAGEPGARS
ncbi:MAG: BtrH N-terminal domain-containing protein [Marmoricola sp.]